MSVRFWDYEICKRCCRPSAIGFTVRDSDWERIVGGRYNVLCFTCFEHLAFAARKGFTLLGLYPVARVPMGGLAYMEAHWRNGIRPPTGKPRSVDFRPAKKRHPVHAWALRAWRKLGRTSLTNSEAVE